MRSNHESACEPAILTRFPGEVSSRSCEVHLTGVLHLQERRVDFGNYWARRWSRSHTGPSIFLGRRMAGEV